MHFLYVDESGDTGAKPGSSSHFILCGLLIHHASWHHARQATKAMRQRLEDKFGFPQLAELHASEFLSKNGMHFGLPLEVKIKCALHAVGFLGKNNYIRPIRIIAEKLVSTKMFSGMPGTSCWRKLTTKEQATMIALRMD